jgi:hypothetical protein
MDPHPAIFVIDLQDGSKKNFFTIFSACYLLFEGTFTLFFEDVSQKESQNSRIQDFS